MVCVPSDNVRLVPSGIVISQVVPFGTPTVSSKNPSLISQRADTFPKGVSVYASTQVKPPPDKGMTLKRFQPGSSASSPATRRYSQSPTAP